MNELSIRIKAEFDRLKASDTRLAALKHRLETASDFSAVSEYSRRLAELTRKAIETKTVPGELDIEQSRKILDELLRDNYNEINTVCEEVQRRADRKAGLGLRPQRADYPAERVQTVAGAAAFGETDEQKIRRLASPAENITVSFQTDYIEKNADYRSRAGLEAYIERTDGAGCCKWCAALAGRYRYPDDIPDDIFRRHDNCTCDVTYVSSKGRQNVHTKRMRSKTWSEEQDKEYLRQRDAEKKAEREKRIQTLGRANDRIRFSEKATKARFERIEYANNAPKPMQLTREQAKAKESEILAQRRLTYDEKRGIIQTVSSSQDFMDREHKETLSRYVKHNGKLVREEWSFKRYPLGGYSNIWSQTYSDDARAMAEYLNKNVNNGKYGTLDRIVIAKNADLRGISSYDHTTNTLYISEELISKEGFEKLVDTNYFPARNLDDVITHELDGHKRHWDMVREFYNDNPDKYSSLEDAKQDYERSLRSYIVKQQGSDYYYVKKNISENAFIGFEKSGQLNEIIADCEVLHKKNGILDNELKNLFEELMRYDGKSK